MEDNRSITRVHRRKTMKLLNHDARYLGADGCRGEWITAVLDHGELHLERYQSLVEATAA